MTTSHLNWLLNGERIHLADPGRAALDRYFARFMTIAKRAGAGFLLDTATWRVNMGRAPTLGFDEQEIRAVNKRVAAFALDLRDAHAVANFPMLSITARRMISGLDLKWRKGLGLGMHEARRVPCPAQAKFF